MACTQGMFQNFSLAYATYATYQVHVYTFFSFFSFSLSNTNKLLTKFINHVGRTGQHVVVSPVF